MRIKSKRTSALSLASTISSPAELLENYSMWFYGTPKIGKTTLTAMFKNCHHFMFEPGAKSLRIKQRLVTRWEDWLEYQKMWAKSSFTTATVDVVEIAYEMCFNYMCRELGIDHPADEMDMGKSWGRIRSAFMTSMQFMQNQPGKGCLFVSHASSTKRKTADGDEIDDIHPALTGKPMEALGGSMDLIGYMHVNRGRRVMQIRGDDNVWAGCRLTEKFLMTNGKPVVYIPLGTTSAEAYTNFMKAFNNQQRPEDVAFLTEKKAFKFRVKK